MTTIILVISILCIFGLIYRNSSKEDNGSNESCATPYTPPQKKVMQTPTTLSPSRRFDKMVVAKFMGFVIKESTMEQVKDTLRAQGFDFREYNEPNNKNEQSIRFTYNIGNIDWDCCLSFKNNVLHLVSLSNYSPNSYSTFQTLSRELSERYKFIYNLTSHIDKDEGTESICFEDKNEWGRFTEVTFDSSPILGQKNIRITYFNM